MSPMTKTFLCSKSRELAASRSRSGMSAMAPWVGSGFGYARQAAPSAPENQFVNLPIPLQQKFRQRFQRLGAAFEDFQCGEGAVRELSGDLPRFSQTHD